MMYMENTNSCHSITDLPAHSHARRRRISAALPLAHMAVKRMSSGMLGIGGVLAVSLGFALPALADSANTPGAFCSRPGFGGTGSWTCTVPTTGGGFAIVSNVPSDAVGGVDGAYVDAWKATNMGIDTVALGTTTTSSTGENAIAVGGGATASAPSATAIGTQALASGNASIAMGQQANATGSGAIALGQGAAASNAGDVALGSGSATQTVVNTAGTTINGHDYVFAGATATSTVSVGDVGAERTVTNVGAGRITASSTDAINGSQLFATNQSIDNLATEIGEVAEGAVLYDTNADGTRANSVTLIGGDPSAPVLISNVAAGVADTDAVNVGQLNEGLSDTLTAANTYTDQVAVTTLNEANNYTDYKFDQLNQDIGAIRSEARQAAAIGLAAASLRYDDRPGKLSAAVGGGIWRGEGALAFGAGYTSEDGRLRTNLSATTAGGHWGAGAGLSYTFN